MKRATLLLGTAAVLLMSGFVLYRTGRAAPAQAAPAAASPLPDAYRHGQQLSGSSFHSCLRGN